ncbi:MAG: UDP-N-acetylmuramate dehydrogenase [Candidatus Dojkabacteria bacterium]|nr:UDP-N-acetylmuramate dehydrogenase [Candidatus Dojkabacteria bacterium]
MTNLKQNLNLKKYNSYRVEAFAKHFIEINNEKDLEELKNISDFKSLRKMVLGDGSNTLFVNDYDGLIIKNDLKGKEIVKETDEYILVKINSGENWHEFVTWAVESNYAGVENMALIPGSIGAAPAQNIAAYGQNQSDIFVELTAFNLETFEYEVFNSDKCDFKYRSSVFKNEFRDKYFITDVTYKLSKYTKELETSYHERKRRYGSLQDALEAVGKEPFGIDDIYNAVIYMRKRRLPDPDKVGTVGSFFINPIVSKEKFEELSKMVSELQHYPFDKLMYTEKEWDVIKDDYVKVPAARFIDERGWKDRWINNVASSPSHGLCIISNWRASGQDILDYANLVKKDIFDTYGIELESEVNIIQ